MHIALLHTERELYIWVFNNADVSLFIDKQVEYEPGDHVGIFPANSQEIVDGILKRLTGVENNDEILQLQILKENHSTNGKFGVIWLWMVGFSPVTVEIRGLSLWNSVVWSEKNSKEKIRLKPKTNFGEIFFIRPKPNPNFWSILKNIIYLKLVNLVKEIFYSFFQIKNLIRFLWCSLDFLLYILAHRVLFGSWFIENFANGRN